MCGEVGHEGVKLEFKFTASFLNFIFCCGAISSSFKK